MGNFEDDLASSIAQIIDEETQDANLYVKTRKNLGDEGFEDFDDLDEDDKKSKKKNSSSKNILMILCIVMLVVVMVTIVLVAIMIIKKGTQTSYSHNYTTAKEYYNDKNYEKAIEYFINALEAGDDNSDDAKIEINMYLYDCYEALDMKNSQIDALNNVLELDKYNEEALRLLVRLYYDMGDGVQINRLIEVYSGTAGYNIISTYAIAKPVASYVSGTYETNITVSIPYELEGAKVYFTIDGSEPTVYATQYTEPVQIGSGVTELKILAISSIGVKSEVVTYRYEIAYGVPAKPILSLVSGSYNEAKKVSITNLPKGATAYYTWDETTPTKDSLVYDPEKEIELIPGNKILSVIIVSEYGLTSSVSKYNYNVSIPTQFVYSQAIDALTTKLIENGTLLDSTILASGEACRFVKQSMEKIGKDYIFIARFDVLTNGTYVSQDYYYGIDCNTLALYTVTVKDKEYVLTPIK